MHMPANNGGDFAPPPTGTHTAVCYRLVDLGTQQTEWQGSVKHQRKVMLSWEFPDEKMEDGSPFTIHQRYTYSSSEKALLRQHLEAWRGKPFTDADLGPGGFNIKNVLGKGCMIQVMHNVKNGKTYANIAAIVKLPKGMQAPAPANPIIYFALDEFSPEIFQMLSEGLRNVIAKSPEYQEIVRKQSSNGHAEPPVPDEGDYGGAPADDLNDPIPFAPEWRA